MIFTSLSRLRRASDQTRQPGALSLDLQEQCKQGACSEMAQRCGLRGIPRGAFGVVGFLRVKDEQKGVQLAEALASARSHGAQVQKTGRGKQDESSSIAEWKQTGSEAIASLERNESTRVDEGGHDN